jgi:hypothetical protein
VELPTQQSDPVYELMVELYTIVNHAQKRLRWTDDVFAEKAGYTDRSILDRTRREVREILSGQDVAIGAPLPIPKWNVVLSFAWAICDDNPSPEFSEWIVTLRRKHVAAKLARPDERGNTTKMRALHKEKRGNARLEPSSDMVEMSPSMREILYQLTG